MALLGMGNGAVFQLVPQRFPDRVGLLTGLVGAAGGLGGFMLSNVLGQMKDRTGSFGIGFYACAVAVALGFVALVCLGPVWRRQWSEESAIRAGLIRSREMAVEEQAVRHRTPHETSDTGNSLRLRLTQKEVAGLRERGLVECAIRFSADQSLRYSVVSSPDTAAVSVVYEGDSIGVLLPRAVANAWTDGDSVTIEGAAAGVKILVEKDFQCLHNPAERDPEAYPNPLAG